MILLLLHIIIIIILEARAMLRFARGLRGGLSYPTRFAQKGPILPNKCFTQTDRHTHTHTETFALLLYRLPHVALAKMSSWNNFIGSKTNLQWDSSP